jgi:RHS repeat-associated protein
MTSGPDFTNLASIQTRTSITYNADNMPTQIVHSSNGTTELTYGGTGERVKKRVYSGGNVTDTYYIGDHFEVKGGETIKYIFAGNLRVAQVKGTTRSFFHKDHLGSSTVMTDASGAELEYSDYAPFGSQRAHTGTNTSDYKYTDQELDAENGLYNYNARLYDPFIGRFISPDTVVQAPYNPQSLNRYSYCLNNPLIYVDPSGHFWGLGEFWDSLKGLLGQTWQEITDAFSSIGNGFMKTMEWISERNIWGVKGIAEAAMGVGNIVGGVVTGDSGQIGKGFTQIGKAVYDTAESAVVDAFGVAIGQLSHLYTIPRDLINLGKLFFNDGSVLKSAGGFIGHMIIPRYGLFGGAGWGKYEDEGTGVEKHTLVALNKFKPLNDTDYFSEIHDGNMKELQWVKGQLSMTGDPRISGVGGLAYKALGAAPFSIWGLITDKKERERAERIR